MFYLLLPSLAQRDAFIAHLRSQGINSVFHYLPLHLSAMGKQFGGKPGDCPVTEELSDCLVRLPFYNELSEPDQAYIVKAVTDFRIG
jgi:dTDP-4-amino-4,6-dideoxygalactose transaminase